MNYIDIVNLTQGTRSSFQRSSGSTLPLVQLPHGMTAFSPQTTSARSWWYDPDADYIEGIRLTHKPSPWIADYCCLLLTPQSDVICDTPSGAHSGMKRRETLLRPNYLRAKFIRSRCEFELVPTLRAAKIRLKFEKNESNFLSVFTVCGPMKLEISDGFVGGYIYDTPNVSAKNHRMYFELRSDGFDVNSSRIVADSSDNAALHIAVKPGVTELEVDFAISCISREQTALNMREVTGESFDKLVESARETWENCLSRIELTDADDEMLRTFYTCLWRTFLYPHRMSEVCADGVERHYSPFTGEVHDGIRYTGNGFWDTYRTNFALWSMINRELYEDFLRSLASDYDESGWLPRWTAMGENGCMPSTLVDSVIAEAVAEGIGDRDLHERLLAGMLKHAEKPAPESRFGRAGIEDYVRLGYAPCDKWHESVNLTLDFAYGDYCIAYVAGKLGHGEIAEKYAKRAKNYVNVYDYETGFMRPRLADGSFKSPFDPTSWGGDYTEASAWQTTFSVQHDFAGLAELMGGREKMLTKLDELFASEPLYRVCGYGTEIHEMTEMALMDLGLCEMNNQPGFALPYIYAALGEVEKSRELVSKICRDYFSWREDGFPGDEDNGSMAAWYVLSVIGKYPICPARGEYVTFEPLCDYLIK